MFALLIILAGDPSFLPRVTWHTSREACERHAQVELMRAAEAGKVVEHVECRAYLVQRMRPVTGEILVR